MNKVLFIGLDAAEPGLIEKWMTEGLLPNIQKLREQGSYSRIGLPGDQLVGLPWPTFYTGMNPGNHGMYHYLQWNPEEMKTQRVNGHWLPLVPFWQRFDNKGPMAVIVDVPLTPGPQKFNGIEINGWGSHEVLVPLETYPKETLSWIEKQIGPSPSFDERYGSFSDAELVQIRDKLIFLTQQVSKLSKSLISEEQWDLFMVVFSATHRAGHQLWGQNEADSENSQKKTDISPSLKAVYVACDTAIGELLTEVGSDVTIFLCSLHGMGFNQSRTEILNEMTEKIIHYETGHHASQRPNILNRMRNLLPSNFRHAVKSYMPYHLQDALTSFWRMGGTDWKKSPVLTLLGDYDGYLRINLKGRESEGIVEPGKDCERWVEKMIRGLQSFKDADTGEPVVKTVLKREELNLSGNMIDRLPDMIVQWSLSPAFRHREIKSPVYGSVAWPTPGRNPEGRTGNHRSQGFLMARGDRFIPGSSLGHVNITDLAPTILDILGAPVPPAMEGTILNGN